MKPYDTRIINQQLIVRHYKIVHKNNFTLVNLYLLRRARIKLKEMKGDLNET